MQQIENGDSELHVTKQVVGAFAILRRRSGEKRPNIHGQGQFVNRGPKYSLSLWTGRLNNTISIQEKPFFSQKSFALNFLFTFSFFPLQKIFDQVTSVTRWLDYFFNILIFKTIKKVYTFAICLSMQVANFALKRLKKSFWNWPKCLNFAKAGHTADADDDRAPCFLPPWTLNITKWLDPFYLRLTI